MTDNNFIEYETIYYNLYDNKPIKKIAGFDKDGTLVIPKSGNKFPENADDWKFQYPNIKEVLNKLYDDGFTIVIFTNQNGISKKNVTKEDVFNQLIQIRDALNIPIHILISTDEGYYRKPFTGMMDFLVEKIKLDQNFDKNNSFYCGDAAGRKYTDKKIKKDFSSSDKFFANNIGLQFKIPEDVFNQKQYVYTYCANPVESLNLISYIGKQYSDLIQKQLKEKKSKEMLIMIGLPASGKSTISKKYFPSYIYINQDTLKTPAKCKKETILALSKEANVIIDNTNLSYTSREPFIELAKEYKYNIRFIILDIPIEICKHLNCVRVQTSHGNIKKIPVIAYNILSKKYEEPIIDNTQIKMEIIKIPFICNFESDEYKKWFLSNYE